MSANGLLEYCKKKNCRNGSIDSIPNLPGVPVFMAGHVGISLGNGEVVEERGFNYGCVTTKLKDRPWKYWSLLPADMMVYEGETSRDWGTFDIMPGSRGDDVRTLQTYLTALNFDSKGVDGIYGINTKAAVEAFQRASGLSVTGVASQSVCKEIKKQYDEGNKTVKVTGARVNVRLKPTPLGNEPVFVVSKGDTFKWLGEENGFYKIEKDGNVYYISMKYSERV